MREKHSTMRRTKWASSRHVFIKDDQLVSLRRVLPEMDEKIREMKE